MNKKTKIIVAVVIAVLLLGGMTAVGVYLSAGSREKISKETTSELAAEQGEEKTTESGKKSGKDEDSKKKETTEVASSEKKDKENKVTTESSKKDKITTEQSGGKTEPTTEARTTEHRATETPSTTERTTTEHPTTEAPSTTERPTTEAPSTTEHTHNWVAQTKTVHHEEKGHYEVVKEAYDEEEPVYGWVNHTICRTCGAILDDVDAVHHVDNEMSLWMDGLGTYPLGYYSTNVWEQTGTKTVHHAEEKKWVVDKKAWDETVTTGYKCSICGATK